MNVRQGSSKPLKLDFEHLLPGQIMKRLLFFCAWLAVQMANGQGTVIFANTSSTKVSTNALALLSLGGTEGVTASTLGGFRYGLFIAPPTVTTISLPSLLNGPWTFTGCYGTNTGASTGGRLSGGVGVQVPGWVPGVTNSFAVVGWSTGLGDLWSAVSQEVTGADLMGGLWLGPNLPVGEFFGLSGVGFGGAGGGPDGLPAMLVFGTIPNPMGTPISSGFELYVTVPEPSALALLALGELLWRRTKELGR